MAKILIQPSGYTFDASAQTVTFTDYGSIDLENVLLITNLVDNVIIYNFADAAKGGTAATNILTLAFNTTAMSDTDELQIWYYDPAVDSGVQYTEGATDASITGNAVLWEDSGNTLRPISTATPLPVSVISGNNQYTEGDVDATITGFATLWEDSGNTLQPVSAATPLPVNVISGNNQYTEGDVDATITGIAILMEDAGNTLKSVPGSTTDGLLVNLGANNDVTVAGVSTAANQTTEIGHLSNISVAIDDVDSNTTILAGTVKTLGTDTYSEGVSVGTVIGAVRRDADTTLVNTTNEFGPLQMDANGRLKVEAFSGETLPVSLTSTTITGTVTVGATDLDIRNLVAATDIVDLGGNALTALQLIDDIVYTDDTSTHATGTSKGALMMAAATPTDAAVNANDIGSLAMTLNRELLVQVNTALPAGTNNIGDVDIASIVPGTGATNLGKAIDTATGATDTGVLLLATRDDDLTTLTPADGDNVQLRTDIEGALWVTTKPSPLEGALTMNATSSDGATALTSTAQAIKASAGCIYGYYIYNPNDTAQFVQFYNTASGSVTVGTTNPLYMLTIPATSGANLFSETGIQFSTAISWAATSTAGGNGAPTTALDAVVWYK